MRQRARSDDADRKWPMEPLAPAMSHKTPQSFVCPVFPLSQEIFVDYFEAGMLDLRAFSRSGYSQVQHGILLTAGPYQSFNLRREDAKILQLFWGY
jgi:hypothetical protein